MHILRLYKSCFMPYLHNLAIQQGFKYPKKPKMVDLTSFYFQSKKVPNSTQRCIDMHIYWRTTLPEVSKKVRHTPYLLKTAEKNIFQIQHFRANFRFKAKKTKSQNHHLEMSDRIKNFSRILIFACIMAEIIPPKIGDGDPSLGRPTPPPRLSIF